jgi:hypothetical protein
MEKVLDDVISGCVKYDESAHMWYMTPEKKDSEQSKRITLDFTEQEILALKIALLQTKE